MVYDVLPASPVIVIGLILVLTTLCVPPPFNVYATESIGPLDVTHDTVILELLTAVLLTISEFSAGDVNVVAVVATFALFTG
jgi:hypothetical protein